MDPRNHSSPCLSRRASLRLSMRLAAGALAAWGTPASAAPFAQWLEGFRARARARGISDATYARVTGGLKPDIEVFALHRNQPEFGEKLWQYLNRRVSDWRITTGTEKAKEYAALFSRIEQDFRSEERRVGKECRSRWSPDQRRKKTKQTGR